MKPKYLLALVVLVIAGAGLWYFGDSNDNGPSESSKFNGSNNQQQSNKPNPNPGEPAVEEVPNALEGELKASDDKKKGNLMVKLNDSGRTLYLNTSRDFSSLIGKQVQISIDGSIDDFRLLDIKAKN